MAPNPANHSLTQLSIGFSERTLCTRCGTCAGVCPVSAIGFDEDNFPILINEMCDDCGLCSRTCPGANISFSSLSQAVFAQKEPANTFDGYFRDAWVGYATDSIIREGAAGGGIITALLADLLQNKIIDGCVVTRMNAAQPWKSEPFIARSRDELLQSLSSRYMVIPTGQMLAEILRTDGKFAIAALPCQVHGIRKAMQEIPELIPKIPYVLGLFCGGSLEPCVVTELLEARNINKNDISSFEFRGGEWPGRIRAKMKNGDIRNLHYSNYKDGAYNYFISLYMPIRCQTCVDGSNEFADISVGDSWTRDRQGNYKFKSHSKILVRTLQGENLLFGALSRGAITGFSVTQDASYRTQKMQTQRKGMNAPLRIARWQQQNLPVPQYDRTVPRATIKEKIVERIVSGCLFLGRHRSIRFPIIRLLTSKYAIPLIQLRLWLKKRKYQKAARTA